MTEPGEVMMPMCVWPCLLMMDRAPIPVSVEFTMYGAELPSSMPAGTSIMKAVEAARWYPDITDLRFRMSDGSLVIVRRKP